METGKAPDDIDKNSEKERIILQASTGPFWKIFIEEIDWMIENQWRNTFEKDPWRRYGALEALHALEGLKTSFMNVVNRVKSGTRLNALTKSSEYDLDE